MNEAVKFYQVEDKVINLRDQNVILDSDVAVLYGVETKRVNKQEREDKVKLYFDILQQIVPLRNK
ncbi:hypothetical protein FACS1894162_4950 [Bacteroidia bacterium]|nr:hypothetical protein FACS1894162_4950 [Bacteroidia bacterium]